jgi:hypothetical protein
MGSLRLIDELSTKKDKLAALWIDMIRKTPNIKSVSSLSDQLLASVNERLCNTLVLWFMREIDRNAIGAFFVKLGKDGQKQRVAVSELNYGLFLSQRVLLDYISNNIMVDSSVTMYSITDITNQIAEFYLLGSYYLMKGYLEDTYVALRRDEAIPDRVLKKYFNDEFFFKDINGKNQ